MHFTAEKGNYLRQLQTAEEKAKEKKLNIWENFVEEEKKPEPEGMCAIVVGFDFRNRLNVFATSQIFISSFSPFLLKETESADSAIPERKVNYQVN